MSRMEVTIRAGGPRDALPAADLWLRARAASVGAIPKSPYPAEEIRDWFANEAILEHELWIAEWDTKLVGVLVLNEDWIDQLYVDPTFTGSGVGSHLVDFAKRRRPRGLRLWTFASNRGARRFYERHGFVEVERTDGSRNDSNAPDIQFAYHPGP